MHEKSLIAIVSSVGAAVLTHTYYKHELKRVNRKHNREIAVEQSKWFKAGWDGGVEEGARALRLYRLANTNDQD